MKSRPTVQPLALPSTITAMKPLSAILTGVVRPAVMLPSKCRHPGARLDRVDDGGLDHDDRAVGALVDALHRAGADRPQDPTPWCWVVTVWHRLALLLGEGFDVQIHAALG